MGFRSSIQVVLAIGIVLASASVSAQDLSDPLAPIPTRQPITDAPQDGVVPQSVQPSPSTQGETSAVDERVLMEARGLLSARREATLSSELAAQITELPFLEGEAFEEGDTLVAFDCSFYEAQLASARASYTAARREVENNRQLARLNSVSTLQVALSEARMSQAAAEVALNRVLTGRCVVPAPFSGHVVAHNVNRFESVSAGDPLIEIVSNAELEVRLIVPSPWLSWLNDDAPFTLTVDETGMRYGGRVRRLGARVDPTSQTVIVIGGFVEAPLDLITGMSGTASFMAPDG